MQRRWWVQLRRISAGAAVLGLLTSTPEARADDPAGAAPAHTGAEAVAPSLSDQGLALYKAREFRRAAEKFLQAYAIDQDPNLLFNIARCYEALSDPAGAIEKYEAYLRSPDIDPKGKERAQSALRSLRAGKTVKAQANGRAPERVPEATPRPQTEPAPAPAASAAPASHSDARALVGWIVTGALAAGTAVSGVVAISTAGQLRDARYVYPGDRSNIDQLSSKTLALSITADALGAATLIMGGLSLYWSVTGSSSHTEIRTGFGPTGVQVMGSF